MLEEQMLLLLRLQLMLLHQLLHLQPMLLYQLLLQLNLLHQKLLLQKLLQLKLLHQYHLNLPELLEIKTGINFFRNTKPSSIH